MRDSGGDLYISPRGKNKVEFVEADIVQLVLIGLNSARYANLDVLFTGLPNGSECGPGLVGRAVEVYDKAITEKINNSLMNFNITLT